MAYGRLAYIGEGTTSYTMDNKTALMTDDNIVMICGDVSGAVVPANGVIYTLPDSSMFPSKLRKVVVSIYDETTQSNTSRILKINTNGQISVYSATTNPTTFYLSSLIFHVNRKFYNSTIGNNDMSKMTSPINAR